MKKIILLSALSITAFAFGQTVAQPSSMKKLSFGFKISPNFSWLKVQEGAIENSGMGLGFSYGLTADYRLSPSPNYWASADILISTAPLTLNHTGILKNEVDNNDQSYENAKFNYDVQYIEVPISFKMKTEEIGNLKYTFQVGIAPSFTLSKRLKTSVTPDVYANTPNITSHDPNATQNSIYDFDGGANNDKNYIFTDDINTARMSLVFAAGVEYPVSGNLSLTGGLKFDNGFTDFLKDDLYKGRHNFLSLQVGLIF